MSVTEDAPQDLEVIDNSLDDSSADDQIQESETLPEEDQKQSESEQEAQAVKDDEIVVTIGEQEPAQEETKAPEWVRELRKKHKQTQQENRELRQRLQALNPVPEQVQLGPKPNLESFDYDSEKYESALGEWYEKKRKSEEQEQQAQAAVEQQRRTWASDVQSYEEKKNALKVKDYDDAEAIITETLSREQLAVVVKGAENPALLFYALGKNMNKAKELSQIQDPVKFAFKVAKLEKDLKVTNKRRPPPPEKMVSGGGGKTSNALDSTLEKLRAEARKTGNYTKVAQYKRRKRQA